eukprot:scaffold2632_cov136-Skeletonema_dohrnii-CCMP3373.AAC.3
MTCKVHSQNSPSAKFQLWRTFFSRDVARIPHRLAITNSNVYAKMLLIHARVPHKLLPTFLWRKLNLPPIANIHHRFIVLSAHV